MMNLPMGLAMSPSDYTRIPRKATTTAKKGCQDKKMPKPILKKNARKIAEAIKNKIIAKNKARGRAAAVLARAEAAEEEAIITVHEVE